MADLPKTFGGYLLLKNLGAGASGDVFLARPTDPESKLPSPVVIKRLHRELASNRELALRFRHEAEIAVAVDSPHVAKIFEIGRVGDTYYMAMEYIAGWTLARVMTDLRDANQAASLTSIRDIMVGALEGLIALHTATDPETGGPLNIIHRDISPKNVMIGEDSITRLIDLGIGKSSLQDWKTATGVLVGSPGYMAPEQTRAEQLDQRADTYAMGVIFWELLTARPYIKRGPVPVMLAAQTRPTFSDPSQHRSDVPKAVDEIARRALAIDPKDRFPSAKDLQLAIDDAIGVRSGARAASTIVGALLWGELGAEKTEMSQLLDRASIAPPQVDEPPREDTVTIAERELEERVSAPRAASYAMAQPVSVAPATFSPQLASDLLPPPPRRGVPVLWVAGLMALTLAVGLTVGAVILKPPEPIHSTTLESPRSVVTGVPAEEAPRIENAPQVHAESSAQPAPVRTMTRRLPSSAKHNPESAKETPIASSPPPAPARDLGRSDLIGLMKRARALKENAAGSVADDLKHLVGALSQEAESKPINQVRARALEAELNRLERH